MAENKFLGGSNMMTQTKLSLLLFITLFVFGCSLNSVVSEDKTNSIFEYQEDGGFVPRNNSVTICADGRVVITKDNNKMSDYISEKVLSDLEAECNKIAFTTLNNNYGEPQPDGVTYTICYKGKKITVCDRRYQMFLPLIEKFGAIMDKVGSVAPDQITEYAIANLTDLSTIPVQVALSDEFHCINSIKGTFIYDKSLSKEAVAEQFLNDCMRLNRLYKVTSSPDKIICEFKTYRAKKDRDTNRTAIRLNQFINGVPIV